MNRLVTGLFLLVALAPASSIASQATGEVQSPPTAQAQLARPAQPLTTRPVGTRPFEALSQGLDSTLNLATFDAAWRIIHKQHFDPTFNGVDWLSVREEYRPQAEQASSKLAVRTVIRQMLATLNQSHFSLIDSESLGDGSKGSKVSPPGSPGFDIRIRKGQVLISEVDPDGPAKLAGIQKGWQLLAIDDQDIGELIGSFKKSATLRPETAIRKQLLPRLHGEVSSRVEFQFDTGGGAQTVILSRTPNAGEAFDLPGLPTFYLTVRWGRLEYDGQRIGVLHFSNWFEPIENELEDALYSMRDCDGIIIDLRGNSGGSGHMASTVAGHFFSERTSLGLQVMRDRNHEYIIRPRTRHKGKRVGIITAPLAILVDETTGSCSEVFSGGMQALGRARVIGERTAGAGLPARLTELPNGDYLLHAIGNFLTAEGESLEGDGVTPDEVVVLERDDLLNGRDAAMTAAAKALSRN